MVAESEGIVAVGVMVAENEGVAAEGVFTNASVATGILRIS